MEDSKLQKLGELIKLVNESISRQEFIDSFKAVHDFVKRIEDKNDKEFGDIKNQFIALSELVKNDTTSEVESLKDKLTSLVNTHLVSVTKDLEQKLSEVDSKLLEIRNGEDGKDGESVDKEEVILDVLKRIPEPPIDTAESIANKLETLKGDDRLDASAIKNLPTVKQGGGAPKSLRWLNDITNAHEATDNQVLQANGDKTFTFVDSTRGSGSGITRTIVVTSGNATAGATASVDYVYLVAGAHTITLPTAVSNTNLYTIKNNHSAAITVNTTSSQTIDGTTSIQISPEDSVDFISTNSNWSII